MVIVGFATFAAPAIFFQMGYAGGYVGPNLAILGIMQLVLAGGVVYVGLRLLRLRPRDIGVGRGNWRRDVLLGMGAGGLWAIVQFGWLLPHTGGADRADIAGILALLDGHWAGIFWYLPLGILGGAVAEEIYNRGFIISVLTDILGGSTAALGFAGVFSVVFFALGHLPRGVVGWIDILIPSSIYVLLFLATRRLTAPIIAHATWNVLAVVGVYLAYSPPGP